MISKAKSITHQHLLSVLNAESAGFSEERPLRILDVGCGDGHFINYLMKNSGSLDEYAERHAELGLKPKYKYQRNRSSIVDWLSIHILKYLSSITLALHKSEIYTNK